MGVASPSFRTGRYSKSLPDRLAGRYTEALSDSKLLELRDEVALTDARLNELLRHLDGGKSAQDAYAELMRAIDSGDSERLRHAAKEMGCAIRAGLGDHTTWRDVGEMVDQRRRLVESEHKRLVAMQQMITSEQAMVLLAVITNTVRKHVTDPTALAAISAEFNQLTIIDASS